MPNLFGLTEILCHPFREAMQAAEAAPATLVLEEPMAGGAIAALSDEYSRKILGSIVARGKTIEEMCEEMEIPLSTAYRRVHELHEVGLVLVERILLSRDGKRRAVYRGTLREVKIEFELGTCRATGAPNDYLPDITFRIWQFQRNHRGSL